MAIQGYFLVFLTIAVHAAAVVEPPTGVVLECRNFHNVVRWNHSQPDPELKFKVSVGALTSPTQVIWVKSPDLHADLSSFSDPKDGYFVSITAVVGKNESVASRGISFSYFMNSPASQKCFLDFPQVSVTAQDNGHVRINFTHPWVLYRPRIPHRQDGKSRTKKSHKPQITHKLPELKYDITIKEVGPQDFHQELLCNKSVCEAQLHVDPPPQNYCVMLSGEMDKMFLEGTEQCIKADLAPVIKPNDNNKSFIIAGTILGVAAFAFIIFMVYRKKTTASSSLPTSMIFSGQRPADQLYEPDMGPCSPTPLLSTPCEKNDDEMEKFPPDIAASTETEFRLPLGVSQDQEDDEYQSGRTLDEDEPSCYDQTQSEYEKRDKVVFDQLAPGEDVEGYRG